MDKHHRKYNTNTGLENFILRLQEYNSHLEYYGGYIDSEHKVQLKCKQCGSIFERYASSVRQPKKIRCYECEHIQTRNKKLIERKYREQQLYLYKQSKMYDSDKQVTFIVCENCGKLFIGTNKYCSKRCRERKHEHIKSRKRIEETKANGNIDNDITLDKLIHRDNNICYICKGECDINDYTYVGKQFVAGNKYPSIDHFIPLSKGGTHTWDNIKLAHRLCNSIKSGKIEV